MSRTIYLFDPETRVLTGSTQLPLDPVETERAGRPVYARINPAIATEAVPPTVAPGMRAVLLDRTWMLEAEPKPEPAPLAAAAGFAPAITAEPMPPQPVQRPAALPELVQIYLDAMARSLGYDDIRTAATYADEPAVPRFQAEGRALRAWRSRVWAAFQQLSDRIKAGETEEPSGDALVDLLPRLQLEHPPAPSPNEPAPPPEPMSAPGAAAPPAIGTQAAPSEPAESPIAADAQPPREAKPRAPRSKSAKSAKSAAAPAP